MNCDSAVLTFDISGTAGLYSQMAGVLAGFAFAAITFALPGTYRQISKWSADKDHEQVDAHVLLSLIAAFLSLLVTTLQYSVLAGERGCALIEGRAASEELLGGVSFAFSILLLLYAIAQLVSYSQIPSVGRHARFTVTAIGPPLAILLLLVGAQDVSYTPWTPAKHDGIYRPQETNFTHDVAHLTYPIPVIMFILCCFFFFLGHRYKSVSQLALPSLVAFPYISLVLSVAAVVRSVSLSALQPSARIPNWEVWTWLFVCSVLLLLQAALLSFRLHPDQPESDVDREPKGAGRSSTRPGQRKT